MACQAEIGSYAQGIKFEKGSLRVLKFLGSSFAGIYRIFLKTLAARIFCQKPITRCLELQC